jgi:hypothetical protein
LLHNLLLFSHWLKNARRFGNFVLLLVPRCLASKALILPLMIQSHSKIHVERRQILIVPIAKLVITVK